MSFSRVLVFAAAATVSATALAEPLDPKQVPADSRWLVHIDLDAAQKSVLWPAFEQRVRSDPQRTADLGDLESATGVRLPQDLHSVTLYGAGFGDTEGVVLLQATVDQPRVLNLLQLNPKYSSEQYGSHSLLSWEDKGKIMFGGFAGTDRVVITQNKALAQKAFDVLDGKSQALRADAVLAQPAGASAVVALAGKSLTELGQKQQNPVLRQVQSAWFALMEQGGNLRLKGTVEAADENAALQLKNMAEGLRSAGQMMAAGEKADPKLKALAPLLPTLSFTQQGKSVSVDWTAPVTDVQRTGMELERINAGK